MGYQIPDNEPDELTAGMSWQWNKVSSDFPPSEGWQLTYLFRGPEDLETTWDDDVSADGDTYQVRIPKASTDLTPGTYELYGYVDDGTDRHDLYYGRLTVWPNPDTAVGEGTHAERTLAVIEAAIEGRLSDDEEEWEIAGRAVKHIPIDELYRLRNRYREEVIAERNPDRLMTTLEAEFNAP